MRRNDTDILKVCIKELTRVQQETLELIREDRQHCFDSINFDHHKKPRTAIDVFAEWRVLERLRRRLGKLNVVVTADEGLNFEFVDRVGQGRTLVVVDA